MYVLDLVRVLRRLRRAPRFSLAVICSSLLSVGPTVIACAVVSAVFLRELAAKAPAQLTAIHSARTARGTQQVRGLSYPDYAQLRTDLPPSAWQFLSAWKVRELTLSDGAQQAPLRVAVFAGDYFEMANATLVRGTYPRADQLEAVVTQRVASLLAAANTGEQLTLVGQPFHVVGTVDDRFRGIDPGEGIDVWIPMNALPRLEASADLLSFRELEDLSVLVESVDSRNATPLLTNVALISARLAPLHGDARGWQLQTAPAQPSIRSLLRTPHGQLAMAPLIVMCCLLLIAATNVANLAGVRAASREHESRLSLAMGMPRRRLLLLEAMEPILLSVVGGVVGLALGAVALRWVSALPVMQPFGLRLDGNTILGASAAAILFGAFSAILPVLRTLRLSEGDIVHHGDGITARSVSGLQRVYLVVQFTLALAFTGVALQLAQAVRQQTGVNVGFPAERVLVVTGIAGAPRRESVDWAHDIDRVQRAVAAVPGVQGVGASTAEFFGGYTMSQRPITMMPGSSAQEAWEGKNGFFAAMDVVSPSYFATLMLPLREGREVAAGASPDGPTQVVVNETLARRIAGTGSAVGRTIYELGQHPLEVIGVAPDIRATASDIVPPTYYRSLETSPLPSFIFYARVETPSPAVSRAITDVIISTMPESAGRLQIQSAEAKRQVRDAPATLAFALSIGLAVLAMVVTATGLYGLAAQVTQSRRKEYGIRAALGASPQRLAATVFRDGVGWTAAGILLGLPSLWVGTQVVRALVVDAHAISVVSAVAMVLAYGLVAFLALLGPAWQAATGDPADSLRAS